MDAMEGQYRKPIEAMREQGERDYVELRKINEVNQYKLRESYQIYKKWVHELAGLEQEIAEL